MLMNLNQTWSEVSHYKLHSKLNINSLNHDQKVRKTNFVQSGRNTAIKIINSPQIIDNNESNQYSFQHF